VVVLLGYLSGSPGLPVAGSYAPIYGILLVCAVLWPERQVLFIIFPMKMRYFTILVGAIALYFSLGSGVSGLGMLSGMVFAYFFLRMPRMRGWDPMGALGRSYKAWKLERAKRKFQVYLKKQRSDRDIN
jgi:membrane associated rhomboid family serine protease